MSTHRRLYMLQLHFHTLLQCLPVFAQELLVLAKAATVVDAQSKSWYLRYLQV
jgi:hypothetical protein